MRSSGSFTRPLRLRGRYALKFIELGNEQANPGFVEQARRYAWHTDLMRQVLLADTEPSDEQSD